MQHLNEMTSALIEINGNVQSCLNRLESVYRNLVGALPLVPTDEAPTSKVTRQAEGHLEKWDECLSTIARGERAIADLLASLESRINDIPAGLGSGKY